MLIYGIATAMVTCVTGTAVVRVRKEIAWRVANADGLLAVWLEIIDE